MNFILEKLVKKAAKDPTKLVVKKPDEDFIPYVCHYDANTILTKNGELVQIIRVTGFSNESAISGLISLRDAVRDAINDHVKENKFAFWFNTIRRKKNITPKGVFKDFFSAEVNKAWVGENSWNDQYVNELYITIITEGIDTSIVNMNGFIRSFSYLTTKSLHNKFLQEAHKKLSKVTQDILGDIKEYGGKLLGIAEWEGVLYSEPMRFFGKIVNLYEDRYPLLASDISDDLASHKIAFGNRELEVIGHKNKNFAAMLSMKEYFEVSTTLLDKILQLPFEFIITQSFDFTFNKKDIEPHEYQDYILKVSGDEDFRQNIGSVNFMESKRGFSTDYGKLQTTIMLISKTQEALEKDIKSALDQFSALGFVVVREDVYSEHCFWSQLPGNFRYLRRQKIINTLRVGGFSALHNFPAGLIAGNHWGSAVTVFNTVLNTPYFFNFHTRDSGHTLILGPQEKDRIILTNFLLAQSRRFDSKLFYFDFNNQAKCFIEALEGHHYSFASRDIHNPQFLQLNPLLLPKNSESKNFLNSFFISLVSFAKDPVPQSEIDFIPQIIDHILALNINNFAQAVDTFNVLETKNIYNILKPWIGEKLAHIFGSAEEINWSHQINAFDLTELAAQKPLLVPVAYYLLHQIEMTLDGSPAIIVLNRAWDLINNSVMAPQMDGLLKRLQSKNCIVIFSDSDIKQLTESDLGAEIKKNLSTEIFMPNHKMDKAEKESYKTILGVNDEEIDILKLMEDDEHHFLLKHDGDSVIASFNIEQTPELLKIFCADEMVLSATEEVIKHLESNDPKVWIPQLIEVLSEMEKERVQEEKARILKEGAEKRRILKEKLGG